MKKISKKQTRSQKREHEVLKKKVKKDLEDISEVEEEKESVMTDSPRRDK